MITERDVLLILYNDPWFTPSGSVKKKTIIDENGKTIEVPESYYRKIKGGEQILIRVSNHGTSLNTWVKRKADPSKSLQNLTVVFSNEPVSSKRVIEPIEIEDTDGNVVEKNLYFVVEQYVYRMENLSKNDFLKFLKKLKMLDNNKVFTDPFKKKPKKKAARTVLIPRTTDEKEVPPTNNPVHPRQTIVANNKDYEVDADGNLIKETKRWLNQIVKEVIYEALCRTKTS